MSAFEYMEQEIHETKTSRNGRFVSSSLTKTTRLFIPAISDTESSSVNEPRILREPLPEISDEIPSGSFDQADEEWLLDRLEQVELDAHANCNCVQNSNSSLSLRLALEKTITIYNEIIGVLLQAYGNHFDDWETAVDEEKIQQNMDRASYSVNEMIERLDLILFALAFEATHFLSRALCQEQRVLLTLLPSIKANMEIICDLLHARTGDPATAQDAVISLRSRLLCRMPNRPVDTSAMLTPLSQLNDSALPAKAISYQSILAESNQPNPAHVSIAAKVRLILKRMFPHHRIHPLKTNYYKSPGKTAICFSSIHAKEIRNKPFHVMIKTRFCDSMPRLSNSLRMLWGLVFVDRPMDEVELRLPPDVTPFNRLRRLMLVD